jgi:hypothetical protein
VRTVKLTKWRLLAVEGVLAAALLAACTAIVVRTVSSGSSTPAPSTTPHTVSLPADGRASATLEVITGSPVLKIGVANLGASGTLLRVSTPGGSPPPQLRVADGDGTDGAGENALIYLSAKDASAITVTLNAAVSWRLDLGGGTKRTVADLRGGQVTGIAVTAGSDVIDLTLPQPLGSVPIKLAAGASQLLVSLPGGIPVRVTAAKGAGEISLDGQDHTSVADGTVFTTPGWAPGTTGFDIDATAGAARIAVTTWAS